MRSKLNQLIAGGFVPHGYCMRWQTDVIGMHVASDIAIALAYFSIPFMLLRFVKQRRDIGLPWLFTAFAAFIVACGSTHLMSVVTLWFPLYRLEGLLKALTATVSVATAAALAHIWPQLLKLPTTTQLETTNRALEYEIAEHLLTKAALEKANANLRAQVDRGLETFKTTFEAAEIGLAHVAPDGRFLLVNHHLCQMVGYTSEELLQLQFEDITHPDDIAEDWNLAQAVLSGQRSTYSMGKRYLHKKGREIWVALHVSLVRDANGRPDHFIAAVKDISDIKAAEMRLEETVSKLAEREQQLQAVFDRAELGDWHWDITRDQVHAHPIVFRQYGYPEASSPLPSSWFLERVHAADIDRLKAQLGAALQKQSSFDLEFRAVQPDGTLRWLVCRGSVIRDESGQAIATQGINLDVTALKDAEATARSTEAQLLTLTEMLPQMLWFGRPNGDIAFYNQQWCKYTGYKPEECMNWGWQPVLHPDDLERCLAAWRHALASGEVYEIEYRLKRHDGVYRWHLGRAVPYRDTAGNIVRWFGSCTDIHDIKMAGEQLRAVHEQLEKEFAERSRDLVAANELNRSILENSPDCIHLIDAAGRLALANPTGWVAFGLESLKAADPVFWPELWPAETRELAKAAIDSAQQHGRGQFRSLCLTQDGTPKWWDVVVTAIPGSNGEVPRLIATARDITALKVAEHEASDARQRLDLALRAGQIGAWTWDIEHDRLKWEQNCRAIFGQPDEEVTTRIAEFIELVHPSDRAALELRIQRAFETGHYDAEYRVIWPDGTVHAIAGWGEVVVSDSGNKQFAGICWDITKRKQAEEALRISEARLREAQEIARLGDWQFDPVTKAVRLSDVTKRIFGLGVDEEITHEQFNRLLPDYDLQRVSKAVEHTIRTGEPFELTYQVLRRDGSAAYVDARGRLECNNDGTAAMVAGTALDVTSRVEAALALQCANDELEARILERTRSLIDEIKVRQETEKNLRAAEARLGIALRFARVATWTWHPQRDQVSWAGPVEALYERAPSELCHNESFQSVILPEDYDRVMRIMSEAIVTRSEFDVEFRIRLKDGSIRWIAGSGGVSIEDGEEITVSGINLDITERKLTAQKMAESEARFRQLADGMPQIVWTANPDGEVDYSNRAWSAYTGLSPEQIRNWGWEQTVHPDDLPMCLESWSWARQTGSTHQVEIRVKGAADGTYRWHLARALPIRDEEGRITKWLGTCPDIDDYKRVQTEVLALNRELEQRVEARTRELSESNRQLMRTQTWLQAVLDSATQAAIIATDNDGRITIFNSGAERLLGFPAASMIGGTPRMALPVEYKPLKTPAVPANLSRRSSENDVVVGINQSDDSFMTEAEFVGKEGRRVEVSLAITPMIDSQGERIGTLAIGIDISARKMLERQLNRKNDELVEQTQRAEEANRAKSDFLATMSHEIRTPMNAILGMADLLWETELEPVQRQYVEIFRRAGNNLLDLVNDILDLSKIESGRFDLEKVSFDLRDVVERTLEIIRPKASAKKLDLTWNIAAGTPVALTGDPARLQQVLLNLLGNAVKFTQQGSIELTIGPAGNLFGHIRVCVTDTGIGIPSQKLESIFEDFIQAESSTTRRFGGTGLGLGICKRLVDRMGGRISVVSELGKGSAFSFDAQFELDESPKLPEGELTPDLVGRRVMVVDDNQTNRLIFAGMCEGWGMRVYSASSVAGAMEKLQQAGDDGQPFELLISDRRMPDGGFEFVSQIRDLYPALPVIMTTSDELPGDTAKSKQIGVAAYAEKPLRRSELLRLVVAALASGKPRETTAEQSNREQSKQPRRILIAEDSDDNRFLLQVYLKGTPFEVVFAANGQAAVEAFKTHQFDLVLMDIQMPVMDGLEATKAIREHEREHNPTAAVPIIALTANARKEDVDASRAAGCSSHLSKPIAKAKLLAAIKRFLPSQALLQIDIPIGFEDAARRYILKRETEAREMRKLLNGGEFERLRVLGHNMKGTGLPYGFPPLSTIGADIEKAARVKDAHSLACDLTRLEQYLATVTADLK